MTKPQIILIGAGGHCHSCIDVIEQEGRFEIVGIVERPDAEISGNLFGYPIINTDDHFPDLRVQYNYAFVSIGQIKSADTRVRIVDQLKALGFEFPSFISPLAHVSHHAWIGAGSIVMPGAVVNAGASIGDHCIINSQSLVEHDAVIGNHVHISTGAIVNGKSSVGEKSFIGSGAVLVHNIELAENSFVRAASLIQSQADCGDMNNHV